MYDISWITLGMPFQHIVDWELPKVEFEGVQGDQKQAQVQTMNNVVR